MRSPFQVLVFISGRGSNLRALYERAEAYTITGVLSNRADAQGLEYARSHGIPTRVFERKDFETLSKCKRAFLRCAQEFQPSLIALAGFMQVLSPELVAEFDGKIVNIHPSLLPRYPGLNTHERVLEAGDSIHGCTVHYVDSGVDTGPIIAQASCECRPNDTGETLAARILPLEHELYPWVVNGIARGAVTVHGRQITLSDTMRRDAERRSFLLPSVGIEHSQPD